MNKTDNQDTLLEFPCDYPVKAFGNNAPGFPAHVRTVVEKIVGPVDGDRVLGRPSKGNRYLAVTVHFEATSKAQVDAVYLALSADDKVVMTL